MLASLMIPVESTEIISVGFTKATMTSQLYMLHMHYTAAACKTNCLDVFCRL